MAYVPNSGSVAAWLQSDNASVITVQKSSVAVVIIGGSVAGVPNQSVSGTVGASIIGAVPVVQAGAWSQSVVGTINTASLISIPGIVSTANSTTATLGSGAVFTGTSEEVKDFGSIVINVFADQVSATDGLSIQQSSNGTNWDITDTYTVPASTGKTFQVQPAARFFRVVYTNGATIQGVFRLQTIYHPQMVKPTSQRAQDAYTNETDLEQQQGFNMYLNQAGTWDRMRGSSTTGLWVYGSVQAAVTFPTNQNVSGSVVAFQGGTRISSVSGGQVSVFQAGTWNVSVAGIVNISGSVAATITNANVNVSGSVVSFQGSNPWVIGSIVGTYGEDVPSTAADKGIFTLGIRNDTVSSLVGADLDYTGWSTDSAGRHLTKPFAANEASVIGHNSIVAIGTGVGSVQLMAAPGAGLKNYLTDFNIANTGTVTTIVIFNDSDASIVGRTIAPAGGGSNHSFQVPLTTSTPNKAITLQLVTASSVWCTVTGYKAP